MMVRVLLVALWLLLLSLVTLETRPTAAAPTVLPGTLIPAKCDAQGNLVCRQFAYGLRKAQFTRITEKDGAIHETDGEFPLGYGPMRRDVVCAVKDLCAFGVDGKPIDPQTLATRLARFTPVMFVDLGSCAAAPMGMEPADPLLEAFRDDLVIIASLAASKPVVSEQAIENLPPPPPKPVRVYMDAQGRVVFHPLDCMLSFETPDVASGGVRPRPTAVKAVAHKCDRYALSPKLVSVFDSDGKPVDVGVLPQLLAKETTALLCVQSPSCAAPSASSGPPKPFELFYLRAAKPGTLVFVAPNPLEGPPAPAPCPAAPAPPPPRAVPAPAPAPALPAVPKPAPAPPRS